MQYIPKDEVQWKTIRYLKTPLHTSDELAEWEMDMILPEPLASWDVFSYWESERYFSMKKNLKQGDILFDIGTEQGWLNLAYAKIVGSQNMVLIEPTQEFWPNIKAIWEKNGTSEPKGFYDGLFSDKTTDIRESKWKQWPAASDGDLIDRNKYQYIHANDENVAEMTLDDYVKASGIVPDALTMDTEGSELLILRGAEKTLRKYKPIVYVSVHPDLGERDYGIKPEDTHAFMKDCGYKSKHLATDHEEHWVYYTDTIVE